MAERFDDYMRRALYGPDGFYTKGHGAGARGRDFITSAEVGPLFGVLVGRWLDRQWHRMEMPDPFIVQEWGAGRGTLAASVARSLPECASALQYETVEHSDEAPAAAPHVILANELLDNLPVRVVRRSGGEPEEMYIDGSEPTWGPVPTTSTVAKLLTEHFGDREDVQPVPFCNEAVQWLTARVAALHPGGALVAIDYAATTVELEQRDGAWMRTYVGHERGGPPWEDPGSQDITCDVPIDQLAAAAAPQAVTSQAEWLVGLGISELVEEGREVWRANAHAPNLDAFAGRSRVSEAEALLDPTGLGGFAVIEWIAGPGSN